MSGEEITGIILAAGEGRRLGELGTSYPKAVLPVCNRPLISYHLELLRTMGVRDVVIVVGYRKEQVISAARLTAPKDLNIIFIEQHERLGIAQALSLTREFVGKWLIVVLGDTYFIPGRLGEGIRLLTSYGKERPAGVLSVRRVLEPGMICRECTVRFDRNGRLEEIREKPNVPFNDLKPCGIYFFSRAIYEAIDRTPASQIRGEVEITDSIQTLVNIGYAVYRAETVSWDRNITSPGDFLLSNLVQLKRMRRDVLAGQGVKMHPQARLHEVVVGDGAKISVPAILERTLILEGAEVNEPLNYRNCIIGKHVMIKDCMAEAQADRPPFDLFLPKTGSRQN